MSAKQSIGARAAAALTFWMPLNAKQVALLAIVLIGVTLSYLVH